MEDATLGSAGVEPAPLPPSGRRRTLFAILAAFLFIGAIALFLKWRSVSIADGDLYRFAEATRGPVTSTVIASGTIQPWTVVDIKSKAGGRVDLLAVEEGDAVRRGQVLARIDPSDSQLSFDQALADLASANAKRSQSDAGYQLATVQNANTLKEAEGAVRIADANLSSSRARLRTARDAARAQPVQTSAAIRQAEAAYRAAQEGYKQLLSDQENARVKVGSSLRAAESAHFRAAAEFERQKQLFAKGFVSSKAVEAAQADLDSSRAQWESAQSESRTLGALQSAARTANEAQVAQSKAQLESVRSQAVAIDNRKNELLMALADERSATEQLKQSQLGLATAKANLRNNDIRRLDIATAAATVSRADAAVVNAKKTLDDTVLRAPTDGVILQKYVEQGTIITSGQSLSSTGTSIVQIGDVSRLYINVLVDETDIARIHLGQSASISVDAFPDQTWNGRITRIEPKAQVDQNITTIAVRVEIDRRKAPFGLLKPNMNATCSFDVADVGSAVRVPTEAVQRDERGAYVNLLVGGKPNRETQTVQVTLQEKRRVRTGVEGDEFVQVLEGLSAGETVLLGKVETNSTTRASGSSPFGGGGPGGAPPPGGGMGGGGGGRGGR